MSSDRIGVFVCSWGSGKDPKLDMDAMRHEAESIDGVAIAAKELIGHPKSSPRLGILGFALCPC